MFGLPLHVRQVLCEASASETKARAAEELAGKANAEAEVELNETKDRLRVVEVPITHCLAGMLAPWVAMITRY